MLPLDHEHLEAGIMSPLLCPLGAERASENFCWLELGSAIAGITKPPCLQVGRDLGDQREYLPKDAQMEAEPPECAH